MRWTRAVRLTKRADADGEVVCLFFYTRGCGRIVRPAFPAPSDFWADVFCKNSDASRSEDAESCFGNWGYVIARSDLSAVAQRAKAEATKQSTLSLRGE